MKKELNYTSPEASEALYKLGIRWKASSYWRFIPGEKKYVLVEKIARFMVGYAAYNVTELGHLIPFGFFNEMKLHKYLNGYFKVKLSDGKWKTYTSECEARASYLIDLIQSKKVIVEKPKH